MTRSTYISLLLAGLAIGCSDDVSSSESVATKTYLISATALASYPQNELQAMAQVTGQRTMVELVRYSVSTYRIVYETQYKGNPIKASGLLYVPVGLTGAAPLISLQHGTTFVKDKAPSVSGFSGMEYFAAAGYVAVMPDFIGYGESADLFHPYYDREHSAISTIDMIKSSKEFLAKENIALNDQLYLAGYSEGGYVTLATAKEIETNSAHNLKITAVAAGAGGYDMEEMLRSVAGSQFYSYPAYLAFVLMSYNTTYDWNKPLNYFFQDKYATALNTYMNGQHDGWQINSRLTQDVNKLLDKDFYSRLQQTEGESELKRALKDNSVNGWKTSLPIRLYHGTRDEIIPADNSEKTLANFKRMGSENVSLHLIQGGTHGSSFLPMLQQFVPWFETLRK